MLRPALAALLFIQQQASALQTYSSVTYDGITVGCAPIESGGEAMQGATLILYAVPECLCEASCSVADASGRAAVALWSSSCSKREQVERLLAANAKAVLLSVRYEGQFPTFEQLGLSSSAVPSDVPLCTVAKVDAVAMRALAAQGQSVEVDGVAQYSQALEEHPAYEVTGLDVLSPWEVKWSFPAGQAVFNPLSYPQTTAKLKLAELTAACSLSRSELSRIRNSAQLNDVCSPCWADIFVDGPSRALTTASRVGLEGQVALFYFPASASQACFSRYWELLKVAEAAGAVGAVFVSNENQLEMYYPSVVPLVLNVPLFSMARVHGEWLLGVMEREDVTVLIHEIENGSGPDYFPAPLEAEIGDAAVAFTGLVPASASEPTTFRLGQATYNPASEALAGVPVVAARIDSACHRAGNEDDGAHSEGAHGVDCAVCNARIAEGTVVLNLQGELEGGAALVTGTHTFCVPSWSELALLLQESHGAEAMLISNPSEVTYTLPSGLADAHGTDDDLSALRIPSFNMRQQDGKLLESALIAAAAVGGGSGKGGVTVSLPAMLYSAEMEQYVASTTLSLTHSASDEAKLEAATITISRCLGCQELVGGEEVGQSAFNPATHGGVSRRALVPAELFPGCVADGTAASCHQCELMDNPVFNRTTIAGNVVLLSVASSACIRPIANYVQFVQAHGAAGVLFYNTDDRIVTMLPQRNDLAALDIRIPSFNLPQKVGLALEASIFNSLNAVIVSLPAIARGTAKGGVLDELDTGTTGGSDIIEELIVEEDNELSGWEIAAVVVGIVAVACSGYVLVRVWKKNANVMHSFRFSRSSSAAQTGEFDNIGLMMDGVAKGGDTSHGFKVIKARPWGEQQASWDMGPVEVDASSKGGGGAAVAEPAEDNVVPI